MNTTQILNLTRHPELLDRETLYELRNLLSRYPYFTLARTLYLHNLYLLREPSFNQELKLAALHVNDRVRLFQIIEGHKYIPIAESNISVSHPKALPLLSETSNNESRTLTLINQFLSQQPEKDPLVPFDLTIDYTNYLIEGEKERSLSIPLPHTKKAESIYVFESAKEEKISENKKNSENLSNPERESEKTSSPTNHFNSLEEKKEIVKEDSPLDESFFTETLAKIYVKQGRYEKALEIIKNINLKNPKKSAYFADQIRFLEKLIINSK